MTRRQHTTGGESADVDSAGSGPRPMATPPRVSLLVSAATGWGRGIIKGVAAFANQHGPWLLQVDPDGDRQSLPAGWRGDGVIARLSTPKMAEALLRTGAPVVNVSSIALAGRAAAVPRVCSDVAAAGTLAARHFLDRGFRNFAYLGLQNLAYVREQREAFAALLARHGHACSVLALGDRPEAAGIPARLMAWLRGLPKPVAVLTWNNSQGRAVIHACRLAGLFVPEDVAVLSGNDDPLLCECSLPPLAAISVASEQIGATAAELLHLLMQRRPLPCSPVLVPPLGIMARQSTDALLVDNPALVQALGYIREHATEPIGVEDVLRAVPVARRSLERFFQTSLGRSPAEEIRRVRLERAKHLLATTDLPVPKVAHAAGFGTGEYLATLLRRTTGMTPLKYRAATRGH